MATQDSDWLWNPYETLDLASLGCAEFTCVGSAVSKFGAPRCLWKIDLTMQLEARQKLNIMAVEQPLSQAATVSLGELVALLLCTQRHQEIIEQRVDVISDWSAKIQDVAVEIERKRLREIEIDTQIETLSQVIQCFTFYSSRYRDRLRGQEEEMSIGELIQGLKTVQQDLDRVQRAAEESNTRSADLASKVTELQVAQHQLKEINSELRQGLKSTQQDLDKARRKAEESNTRSAGLALEVTELQEVQYQLKNTCALLQNNQSLSVAKMSRLQTDLEATNTELQETRRQLDGIKDSFEGHQRLTSSNIRDLNTALAEAKVQTSMFSNEDSNLRVQLQKAETTYDVSNRKMAPKFPENGS